jgi:hypothetical protein
LSPGTVPGCCRPHKELHNRFETVKIGKRTGGNRATEFLLHQFGISIADPERDQGAHVAEHRLPNGVRQLVNVLVRKREAEVQERLGEVRKDILFQDTEGPLVTDWMRACQQLTLPEKIALYRKYRLTEQERWYRLKSQWNSRRERWWFGGLFVFEFAAVGFAALQAWQLWPINVIGTIAAISAGLLAWGQAKRFSDLALSYGIAADDLAKIAAERRMVKTEQELALLVKDTETAVSREHSLWLSKR